MYKGCCGSRNSTLFDNKRFSTEAEEHTKSYHFGDIHGAVD